MEFEAGVVSRQQKVKALPNKKPVAGGIPEPLYIPKLGGGDAVIGGARDNWSLVVIYRGKHCPRCKKYLNNLDEMRQKWIDAGFDILVASADPVAKAQADQDAFGWAFDLGYDLSEEQMAALGLYVSDPLSETETDRKFAEPGVFVFRPDGSLLLISISNGPSARPDLFELLDGMIFTKENNRPPRGRA